MTTYVLDHIVHLTPPGTVELVSNEFRKLGFHVTPGGTHAGGLTYNALVVLPDGTYLELIAFVDTSRAPPSSHRWGTASPRGWIDYAHLGVSADGGEDGEPEVLSDVINARAAKDKSGVVYNAEVDGGREMSVPEEEGGGTRRLRWRITAPEGARHGIGRLPFFCGDVTPRAWRVPDAGGAHPNGARGISHVKLLAANNAEYTTLLAQLTTVVGRPPAASASASHKVATWLLETPKGISERRAGGGFGLRTKLVLEEAEDGAAAGTGVVATGSGIHEVGFWVAGGEGGVADSPYGRIVWTPIPIPTSPHDMI